ncbi:MAG: serine hydrolase [Alphaproteobacteria bacterium]|nr:serine hydrolase [Alphaproteobacteria bacterium]
MPGHKTAAALFFAIALSACTHAPPAAPAQEFTVVDPAKAGWNADALAEAASYAQSQKTTGFLIIQNRKVIYEHNWPLPPDAAQFEKNFTYGPAADGALQEDVASQQKSFIAILAGVAADKGLLDVSKPVTAYLGAGWSKASPDQEAKITVLNLMQMNSGLSESFEYEAPAGAKFFYNTPVYATMKPVLEKVSGKSLDALTREWLTDPAGMSDTAWRQRPEIFAKVGNPTGLVTTPRDSAKMGQILLDHGLAASGKRIVSDAWIKAMLAHSPTNPAYGRFWWLNGGDWSLAPGAAPQRKDGPLIPAAPADLVAALGAQDRKVFVVPGRKLIVVRMGQQAPDRDFNQQLWLRVMKAAPPA